VVRADHALVRTVAVHDPGLVAAVSSAARLKDQLLAVPGKIGLAVVSVKGQPDDVFHVPVDERSGTALALRFPGHASAHKENDGEDQRFFHAL